MRHFSLFLRVSRSRSVILQTQYCRRMSNLRSGLVLGVYEDGDKMMMTPTAKFFDQKKSANLLDLLRVSGLAQKKGKCRVFYNLDSEFTNVAVVNLGKKDVGYNPAEEIDESKESIRTAVAAGVKQLQEEGITTVSVDPCDDPEAAGEGAILSIYHYDELKSADKRKAALYIKVYTDAADDASRIMAAWNRGVTLAEGQNFARKLMETPANHMTPTRFAQVAEDQVGRVDKVEVTVRERDWAESMKMFSYLSVTNGSDQPPKFVEVHYKGGPASMAPLALVGKGITFDSGGTSIKPAANMDEMRADMGGAACTLASIYTAARLKLPINLIGLMPMCENMPGGRATKPGDVVTAMNGKTIQIDNTDAEGRLVLADALCYAETFRPQGIIDMATLTGAIGVALGSACSGVFTNSQTFWEMMHKSGAVTGDRVWRMPLFRHYLKKMSESPLADLVNTAGRPGGACNAAAFLKEFVTNQNWMHMDIAGVMNNKSEVPYLCKGMAGRPTRTVVEFINRLSQQG